MSTNHVGLIPLRDEARNTAEVFMDIWGILRNWSRNASERASSSSSAGLRHPIPGCCSPKHNTPHSDESGPLEGFLRTCTPPSFRNVGVEVTPGQERLRPIRPQFAAAHALSEPAEQPAGPGHRPRGEQSIPESTDQSSRESTNRWCYKWKPIVVHGWANVQGGGPHCRRGGAPQAQVS